MVGLAFLFLAFDHGRADVALDMEDFADAVAPVDVFRDPFGHDVLGALQGFLNIVDALARIDITRCEAVDEVHILCHDLCGKRLQALFAGDGGAGAAFGLVWQIQILDFLQGLGVQYLLLQFWRELLLLADGGDDAFFALLEFNELFEAFLHGGHILFVHRACHFFAVAGDEGDGGAFVEEVNDIGHMVRGQVEFLRDLRGEVYGVGHKSNVI